jgi:hypothetical protein
MLLIISSISCYLLGAATGILVYRNNITKLKAAEDKAKAVIAAAKQ